MGYYLRGDYYRGDYYRGDPFLGALAAGVLGGAVKKAAGWVGRRIGGAVGRAGGAIGRGIGATPPILRDAAGSAVAGAAGYQIGKRMPTLGPIGEDMGLPFFGKRKYRRINPLNPKALKRALRRAEGFEKFAKRTVNAMYKVIDGRRVKTFKRTRKSA